jgi:hypothetical protein
MNGQSKAGPPTATDTGGLAQPVVVDRATFQAQLDALRVREKAHTREGDAIAAARRRLPVVDVDPAITLIGERGAVTLLEVFEGRRQLIAYYFMWHPGLPAAQQCEGCTWVATQVTELSYLHSRDITYAVFCQGPAPGTRRVTRPARAAAQAVAEREIRRAGRSGGLPAADLDRQRLSRATAGEMAADQRLRHPDRQPYL